MLPGLQAGGMVARNMRFLAHPSHRLAFWFLVCRKVLADPFLQGLERGGHIFCLYGSQL